MKDASQHDADEHVNEMPERGLPDASLRPNPNSTTPGEAPASSRLSPRIDVTTAGQAEILVPGGSWTFTVLGEAITATNTTLRLDFLEPEREYTINFTGPASGKLSFVTPGLSWAWKSDGPGPGSMLAEGCPLGFLFRNAAYDTLYASMAGHCPPDGVGKEVGAQEFLGVYEPLGTIVAEEHSETGDWQLIRLYDNALANVTPSVRHWSGPLQDFSRMTENASLCWYGQGFPYAVGNQGAPARCGTFAGYLQQEGVHQPREFFFYTGPTGQGDSSGPIIEHATGHAIGVVNSGAGPLHAGETICSLLAQFKDAGWDLRLATALYESVDALPSHPQPLVGTAQPFCTPPPTIAFSILSD